jgi:hypothetical protein
MTGINNFFTSTTNWIVPSDWNNTNNYMAVIGAGGGDSCGGGGGFSSKSNISLTPGTTIYVHVGPHTPYPQQGGNSWINIITNAQPSSGAQGILGTGGINNDSGGGGYNLGGQGFYGDVNYSGGRGYYYIGTGGGAAGPHGNGLDANSTYGGTGDAGYGGAGGYQYIGYNATGDGKSGTEWGNYGSGGGGGYNNGGLYGGGGGDVGAGGQGLVVIFYTPGVITPANTANGGAVCTCALPIFNPGDESTGSAKAAQYYWAYGNWTSMFSGSSSHYDNNYNKLLSLTSDNDTTAYDNQYDMQTNWTFTNEQENLYSDYPRVWKSRSNEWVDDGGQRSVWCRHRVAMANSLCLPFSNPSLGYVTCTTNMLYMDEQTYGWRLSYTYNYGMFLPGDIVAQNINANTTVYGTVYQMDTNYIWINIPVGQFFGEMSVYNSSNPSVNAWVVAATAINEKYSSNVFINQSRYISKSTLLATGQDAEDLQVYLSAYRPANTNFKVYGKVINGNDPNLYANRIWSRLVESTNTVTSFSSSTNLNDFVNVMYDFPVSQLLYGDVSGCNCSSDSLYVTVPSTNSFHTGLALYLTDSSTGAFNVRGVAHIVNSSVLQLLSLPSFSNTTNVNVGIIPGLEDETGAFLYDGNSNIMRYLTPDDIFFDSFNQFSVKIVPISDNPVVVPRVSTLSTLALQAD